MNENVWYIAADKQGHTSDPAIAMHDLTGAPVISPGNFKNLVKRNRARLDLAWERLLDQMEKIYEHKDFGQHSREDDAQLAKLEAQLEGMRLIMAVLEHGQQAIEYPETTEYKIEREADRRYEQSSEG